MNFNMQLVITGCR